MQRKWGGYKIRKWRIPGKNQSVNVSESYHIITDFLKAAKLPGVCSRKGPVRR